MRELATFVDNVAQAGSAEQAMRTVVEGAAHALGADACTLWLTSMSSSSAEPAESFGQQLPNGEAPSIVIDSIRSRSPIWHESVTSLPLIIAGRSIGALALTFAAARAFGEDERASALVLGQHAAQALERARLAESTERAPEFYQCMLGIVCHDLRNPLGVIGLKAEHVSSLLGSSGRDASVKQQLAAIARAAGQMERLIRDLLDFSALEAGSLEIHTEPHSVSELTKRAIEALGTPPARRTLSLDLDVDSNLRVLCDANRTLQVFKNLLGNAIKFTRDEGSIVLGARREAHTVCFEVRDDGAPIGEAQLLHLFDRYWQAEPGERRGLGIGLFVSRAIIERQGGRIWAESPDRAGAVFRFTLPVHTA